MADETEKPDGSKTTFSHQLKPDQPESTEEPVDPEALAKIENRKQRVSANERRLAERKEHGELSEADFGFNEVSQLDSAGIPLSRKAVGNRAVVITQEDLEYLGGIEMVTDNGETVLFSPEVTGYDLDERIIIWPEELGDI